MGADSFTPITTKTRLSLPLNGIIYTTTRGVPSEKPLPVVGDTMQAELGPDFATSRIVAVGDGPDKSKGILSITHATIPSEAQQLASNWDHTTCDIGGIKFDSVSRTVIMLASDYSETTPATGSPMPNGTPFTAANYILENRVTVNSGSQLEPVFRVERRTYVKRVSISDVVIDLQTGNSKRSVTTLYYSGESLSGTTIDLLAANPNHAYWGLQANGVFRELEQLSEKWFAVTESMAVAGSGPLGSDNPAKTRVQTRPTPIVGDIIFYETGVMPATTPEYGSAHYDSSAWPNHKLALIRPADKIGFLFEFVYVAARDNQDTYNAEFSQADIGGNKFNAITRTYITRRSTFNPDSPTQGTTMATALAGAAGTYILAERKQTRTNDQEIDNLFVVDVHTYVKRATLADINTDPTLGVGVQKLTTLYYRGEVVAASTPEALFAAPSNVYWGIQASGINRQGQQLTDNWFAVIETSSRETALLAFKDLTPTSVNLQLPAVLNGITVTWNKAESSGAFNSDWVGESAWTPTSETSTSLAGSESAKADASASLQPDIAPDIVHPEGNGIPATACFFYMKKTAGVISEADFLARLAVIFGAPVNRWPRFNAVAHSIVCKGQKVAVSAQASGSAAVSGQGNGDTGDGHASHEKNEGSGTSYDVSTSTTTINLPPTIHGAITITGTTETATATSTCDVGWVGGGSGAVIAGISLDFPSVAASAIATLDAEGEVTPASLAATTPAAIPNSGLYLYEPRVQAFEPGWVQCYVEVFNAADIL